MTNTKHFSVSIGEFFVHYRISAYVALQNIHALKWFFRTSQRFHFPLLDLINPWGTSFHLTCEIDPYVHFIMQLLIEYKTDS